MNLLLSAIVRFLDRVSGYREARRVSIRAKRLERELEQINDDLQRAREPVILWRARS